MKPRMSQRVSRWGDVVTLGELVRLAEESAGGEEWGEYRIITRAKCGIEVWAHEITDVDVVFDVAEGVLILEEKTDG
jgi:hypothetical protein